MYWCYFCLFVCFHYLSCLCWFYKPPLYFITQVITEHIQYTYITHIIVNSKILNSITTPSYENTYSDLISWCFLENLWYSFLFFPYLFKIQPTIFPLCCKIIMDSLIHWDLIFLFLFNFFSCSQIFGRLMCKTRSWLFSSSYNCSITGQGYCLFLFFTFIHIRFCRHLHSLTHSRLLLSQWLILLWVILLFVHYSYIIIPT